MFAIGNHVKCVDATGQPTLESGKTYKVARLTDRGVVVESATGELPYTYAFRRFVLEDHATHNEDYDTEYVRDNGVYWRDMRYALLFSRDRSGAHAITYGFIQADISGIELSGGKTIAGAKFRTIRTWARSPDPKQRGAMGLATFGPAPGSRISAPADGSIGDVIAIFWVTPDAKARADVTHWNDQ